MNKRILISLSIIGMVTVIAIGGTIAYFNDVETSTGNTFTAGTLDLQVGNDDPTTWKLTVGDIKPGDSGSPAVWLQNSGSLDGYLHITFANLVNDEMGCPEPEQNEGGDTTCDNPGPDEGELAENLDILVYLDENGNTNFDLGTDPLIYRGKVRGILQGDLFNYLLASGDSKEFRIEWELDSSVGNIVQSDKTGYDIIFELTQNQKNIVGDWHFDEGTGNIAYDSSGNGNQGTLYALGPSWTTGKYNPALYFGGNKEYVSILHSPSLDIREQITIEAWVNLEDLPQTYSAVVSKGTSHPGSYMMHLDERSVTTFRVCPVFYIGGSYGNWTVGCSNNLNYGQWYHVVVTYDGSVEKTYVNGALQGQETRGGNIDSTVSIVEIGHDSRYSYETRRIKGTIDEVKIYPKALSGAEILENYQKGL